MSSTPFPDLVDRLAPSIVGLLDGPFGGSGVVVAPGVAVTLARNVPGEDVTLATTAGPVPARVTGRDVTVDLAALRFDAETHALPPLAWAEPGAPLRIGVTVHAFGDPGGRGLRATTGAVASAPRSVRGPGGRLIDGVVEHTAPLPRGAGGGPLVDPEGRVLGLNAVRQRGGLLLAWPAAALAPRVAQLAEGRATAPPRLGIAVASPRQSRRLRAAVGLEPVDGLLVRDVEEGSPAERAGLRRGDVLVSAGDAPLDRIDALYTALDAADGTLRLGAVRGAEPVEITIALQEP